MTEFFWNYFVPMFAMAGAVLVLLLGIRIVIEVYRGGEDD